jgi:hypothetical protein
MEPGGPFDPSEGFAVVSVGQGDGGELALADRFDDPLLRADIAQFPSFLQLGQAEHFRRAVLGTEHKQQGVGDGVHEKNLGPGCDNQMGLGQSLYDKSMTNPCRSEMGVMAPFPARETELMAP